MRNYKHYNSYQTSREYYINELKDENNSLNSSVHKLDILEYYLEKILDLSYRFFEPFFKDDFEVAYKNEYKNNNIDEEFDKKINLYIPTWLHGIITLLSSVYNKFFPKEKIKIVLQKLEKYRFTTLFLTKNRLLKSVNKFFAFKSPP